LAKPEIARLREGRVLTTAALRQIEA